MKGAAVSMVVWLVLAEGTLAHADTFRFDDFSDTSALSLNGGTAVVSGAAGQALRLSAFQVSAGSAFTLQQFDVSSFTTHFTFQITAPGGMADMDGEVGADGIVFIMQPLASNKVGAGGGFLGYAFGGISPSVAVEFDTFRNYDESMFFDPDSNHVAVDLNGEVSHKPGTPPTAAVTTPFDNGELWDAWISYDGTTLTVEDGAGSRGVLLSYDIDIPAILGRETAYIGFSSATAGSYGNHDLLSWSFGLEVPEPCVPLMLIGGGVPVAVVFLRRRRKKGSFGSAAL